MQELFKRYPSRRWSNFFDYSKLTKGHFKTVAQRREPPEYTLLKEEAKAIRLYEANGYAGLAKVILSALKAKEVNDQVEKP